MPIYEYECKKCKKTIELLLRNSKEKPICPECGQSQLEKIFSVTATPSIREGRGLPVSSGDSCGAPRCCGGGCDF